MVKRKLGALSSCFGKKVNMMSFTYFSMSGAKACNIELSVYC